MIYEIRLSDQVKLDLVRLAKSEPIAIAAGDMVWNMLLLIC